MGDFKDTVFPLHQGGLESKAFLEAVRQTGGTGLVVSNDAIFNPNVGHRRILQSELKVRGAKRPESFESAL